MLFNPSKSFCFFAATLIALSCSHHEHSDQHESEEKHEHSGEIVISHEDADRFGIKTETVGLEPFNSVIRVTGQIVSNASDEMTIVAPTSGVITLKNIVSLGAEISSGTMIGSVSAKNISGGDPNEAARVAVEAAKRELDRLEPLMKEGIVTKKEYNAALAAYQSARSAYSPKASSGAVSSPISGIITEVYVKYGDFVNTGDPIVKVGKNASLLLQADLPEKYRASVSEIISANIRLPYSDSWVNIDSIGGKRLPSSANASISRSGYIPVMFALNNNGSLSSGAFVDVCLIVSDQSESIAVDSNALIEQQGNYFVFVKKNDHGYEKRKVVIGQSDGVKTRILSGINPGDNIVTQGATIVRLAENSGNIPHHTHNH